MAAELKTPKINKLRDQETGQRGEDLALELAVSRGWQAWQRQVRVGKTEIDLALLRDRPDGRHLLLLEVKTTRGDGLDHARRWSSAQQRRLWRAAEVLVEQAEASHVEVALVLVQLAVDRETVTWLDAQPF